MNTYLNHKAEKHYHYKFYSDNDKIENILKNKAVYLSNGANWNDIIDKDNFNSIEYEYMNFGLCLSYSRSENVAMWMLYNGNKGLMIDYSPKAIKNILDAESIKLGFFDKGKNFKSIKTLNKGEFKIQIVDIVYYGTPKSNNNNKYYVKRSDETNQEFDKKLIDALPFCKKTLPWSYENECRLIVSINKKVANDCDTVEIKFSEDFDFSSLLERVYVSPNNQNDRFQNSNLSGKINWNLCKNCKHIT